jgi:hypothetical protein
MGTQRLGTLPDTAPWRRVVELIAEAADAAAVATATNHAAKRGLQLARNDEGLVYCTHLLVRVVVAARQSDFTAALITVGIDVPNKPGLFDIVASFSDAVDRHLHKTAGRSDIGEMAQLAAVESLTQTLGQRAGGFFGTEPADVRRAARELSTERGFATLAHDFFARFTQRFLTYHLGRELSNHVGGNGRFASSEEHNEFVEQLGVHCRETAGVMRDFAGAWYSKQSVRGEITPTKTRGFVNHCLTKLYGQLAIRGKRDG